MAAQLSASPAPMSALDASSVRPEISAMVDQFQPVSLPEMDAVALLERRDTKFVMSERQLVGILPRLVPGYRVLEVEGRRLHTYRTVYFDTPALDLFLAHHNAKPVRFKVRSRLYVESRTAFFEIKARDARDNTVKSRTGRPGLVTTLSPAESTFIETHAPGAVENLSPRLLSSFSRITLVNFGRGERLTLNLGLAFAANGEITGLPGLVVAELKHGRASHDSPFMEVARAATLHPSAFSKYCVGVSLLYPGIKHNRFNPELRLARRISGDFDVR